MWQTSPVPPKRLILEKERKWERLSLQHSRSPPVARDPWLFIILSWLIWISWIRHESSCGRVVVWTIYTLTVWNISYSCFVLLVLVLLVLLRPLPFENFRRISIVLVVLEHYLVFFIYYQMPSCWHIRYRAMFDWNHFLCSDSYSMCTPYFCRSNKTLNLQKHELCSATMGTPPLESTHRELSFEWSHL